MCGTCLVFVCLTGRLVFVIIQHAHLSFFDVRRIQQTTRAESQQRAASGCVCVYVWFCELVDESVACVQLQGVGVSARVIAQACFDAHFTRVSAAPCIAAEGTGQFLEPAGSTGLDNSQNKHPALKTSRPPDGACLPGEGKGRHWEEKAGSWEGGEGKEDA